MASAYTSFSNTLTGKAPQALGQNGSAHRQEGAAQSFASRSRRAIPRSNNKQPQFGSGKRRSVTLFCHINSPRTHYFEHDGDDAMHFANYIVLGLLVVCMLSAAAMALSRVKPN
jgi:hypothetical protein